MAIRVCSDLNLFQQIVEQGPITSTELALATGADKILIGIKLPSEHLGRNCKTHVRLERLLRVLTASYFLCETAVTTYAPNRVTEILATRTMTGLVEAM